jgi:hypothetical protein
MVVRFEQGLLQPIQTMNRLSNPSIRHSSYHHEYIDFGRTHQIREERFCVVADDRYATGQQSRTG